MPGPEGVEADVVLLTVLGVSRSFSDFWAEESRLAADFRAETGGLAGGSVVDLEAGF